MSKSVTFEGPTRLDSGEGEYTVDGLSEAILSLFPADGSFVDHCLGKSVRVTIEVVED